MALGSSRRDVARLVLRQGAVWMGIGVAAGLGGIVVVANLLRPWLYRVDGFDPLTVGGVLALLLGCATVALLAPVRRATRADPLAALRGR